MKNLTPHQEQLVNDMIAEFSRINPKPTAGEKKRFSIASIDECNQEKHNFLKSLAAYNSSFLNDAVEKIRRQLDEFIEEFDEAVGVAEGSGMDVKFHRISDLQEGLNRDLNAKTSPNYVKITLFPTYLRPIKGTRYGPEDGNMFSFYAGIKCNTEKLVCSSGETVYSAKYESIWWGRDSYPAHNPSEWELTRGSLEDFLQSSELLQQEIVRISNIKPNIK